MQTTSPSIHFADSDASPLLEAHSLAFERDDQLLFDQLDLSVLPGDIVQVTGANGAGKTTLLRLLTGALSDFDGEVFWRGQSMKRCRTRFAAEMLYLGHQPGIKSTLTPEENLLWLSRLQPMREGVAIRTALADVGLSGYEDVPCYSLSAGQQRRVALARLHLSAATLWVLDEPFTAIDRQGVAELERQISEHAARGGAVLLTTHQSLSIGNVRTLTMGAVL